ncbi:esterase-like activity of phytase family protein [Acinetobacter rudis]|uniref:Esterase-like activity of phytase family protein n=1 Tax=Acinetobacter rudis TaxID=632955 RepID=A0AAW8J5G8_9GAMM|nr:esterase-like activity of phytase family protein [Acinetobacter rudis]MDQ8934337.1 esterase-like activity of phytase family protein [Acinetobacter rudis]MDQ9016355.1 esterase-like activity of phytase family protein [Acinetobacter rudis]
MEKKYLSLIMLNATLVLTACGDNKDSSQGEAKILTRDTALVLGNDLCWHAGTLTEKGADTNHNGILDANEVKEKSVQCGANLFAKGVALPYSILGSYSANATIIDKKFDLRQGGYGSDLAAHPSNKTQFYALTDRGPNADYDDGIHGAGKIFPMPDYVPKIGLFEVQSDGSIKQLEVITLKDRNGKEITGLPNTAALGGTGETPYDLQGKVITVNANQPYDPVHNPMRLDDYGLDSEGLAALKDGTFWVSDEYGPHIVHYDANGRELERINPFSADKRNKYTLPNEFSYRRANRGMEGLTITPDQKTLVGIMQSTMNLPTSAVNKSTLTRIISIDLASGKMQQYLYRQEGNAFSNSAIVAINNHEFLVLERDEGFYLKDPQKAMKRVYKIDLNQATNLNSINESSVIKHDKKLGLTIAGQTLEQFVLDKGWEGLAAFNILPAPKTLVVDMIKQVNYAHDKMEGIWLIDGTRLGLLNDDDFGLWKNAQGLEQKYLDLNYTHLDRSTLYVVDNLKITSQK